MCDTCRVNITTTLEDQSVHVEKYDDPQSLLYAAEGEAPVPPARQALRYIRKHRERPLRALLLRLQPDLPSKRLHQAERAVVPLLNELFRKTA